MLICFECQILTATFLIQIRIEVFFSHWSKSKWTIHIYERCSSRDLHNKHNAPAWIYVWFGLNVSWNQYKQQPVQFVWLILVLSRYYHHHRRRCRPRRRRHHYYCRCCLCSNTLTTYAAFDDGISGCKSEHWYTHCITEYDAMRCYRLALMA